MTREKRKKGRVMRKIMECISFIVGIISVFLMKFTAVETLADVICTAVYAVIPIALIVTPMVMELKEEEKCSDYLPDTGYQPTKGDPEPVPPPCGPTYAPNKEAQK